MGDRRIKISNLASFNGHPPLGVNATGYGRTGTTFTTRFNGHPPLGVNATGAGAVHEHGVRARFQWAPTLGGECYWKLCEIQDTSRDSFNGHPPLGVNATV